MLHFHVSHLAGLFKEKPCSCCQWYNCSAGALGSLHSSEGWLIPAALVLAAMNTKWYWRKNGESYRSSKDRDLCHIPVPFCPRSLHHALSICFMLLMTAQVTQLGTQRLWAAAQWAVPVTHLQQHASRKAGSKIPFWHLTAKRFFSYSAESLLCARSPFQKGQGTLIISLFP